MKGIEKTIDVDAPVRAVYNQWTQFEDFPNFMEGVEEVRQLDDTHLHWKAKVGGKEIEWDSEIVEQIPDEAISWRSISGKMNDGAVRFDKIDENHTRVRLVMDLEPETVAEKVGTAVGVPSFRIGADLKRFKKFIESRKVETGEWRGEVHGGRAEAPQTTRH